MPDFKFRRGTFVTDKITGFKGVIVCRMDSLTGCNRYCVEPQVDKEGKRVDGCWIDEHAIEIDITKQQLRLDRMPDEPPG